MFLFVQPGNPNSALKAFANLLHFLESSSLSLNATTAFMQIDLNAVDDTLFFVSFSHFALDITLP